MMTRLKAIRAANTDLAIVGDALGVMILFAVLFVALALPGAA